MSSAKKRNAPHEAFRDAVASCKPLQLHDGLQAVKKGEGKDRISPKDTARLLGSVNIDDDCRGTHPNDNRWDYAIGYDRNGQAIVYFIEVHSAETTEVSTVEKKFLWLLDFLAADKHRQLKALPAEFLWVASGRVNIPPHLPQYKKLHVTLRKRGLRFSGKGIVLE